MPSFYDPKNMLFNPDTAFDRNDDEFYLGTWFGLDAWAYKTSRTLVEGEWSVLLVEGNEPGNYMTWVGTSSWFAPDAIMGTSNGSIPMVDHLTKSEKGLAYLMAFAALHHHPKNK
tara:strand:+ start:372 stop:716 length:345 start_codon:yes stop_codon:yes gene_type:complete